MPTLLTGDLQEIFDDHERRGRVRTIPQLDGTPLFYRVYLDDRHINPALGKTYLHKFVSSDMRVHHNHPWDLSSSTILHGSYIEHTPWAPPKRFTAGDINTIAADQFHFLELDAGVCWSLFSPGKRVQDWGFLIGDQFIPHGEYR